MGLIIAGYTKLIVVRYERSTQVQVIVRNQRIRFQFYTFRFFKGVTSAMLHWILTEVFPALRFHLVPSATTLYSFHVKFRCCLLVSYHCSIIFLFVFLSACYWTGLCYVYIKVALVSLLELGIFPVLCGLWIDACTLVSPVVPPCQFQQAYLNRRIYWITQNLQ